MSARMGTIAEQKFKLLCMEQEIPLFEPSIDEHGADFVIRKGKKYIAIQVKSTMRISSSRNSYRVKCRCGKNQRPYRQGDFDFLVIYIFELSLWYIIPQKSVTVAELRINPNSNKNKYHQYKEAWHLIG